MHRRKKYNGKQGFTLIELVIVLIITGIIFAIVGRTFPQLINAQRYKATIAEMTELRKALIGDETVVKGGQRTDFGWFRDNSAFPTTAKFGLLLSYIQGDFENDAWGTAYQYRRTANTVTIESFAADGANGGTGFNEDIMLVLDRDRYEDNTVIIQCKDSQGAIIRGRNVGEAADPDIPIDRIRFRRILADGSVENFRRWRKSNPGANAKFLYDEGIFRVLDVSIGRYLVEVRLEASWCDDLNEGNEIKESTGCVIPKGTNSITVFEVRFPGSIAGTSN